jgi:hypothetical protein
MTEVRRVFKVNGKPFFPIGGQSASSSAYNDSESEPAFKAVKVLHGNTLLTDVYWEQVEPEEGKFDFTSVDNLLAMARRYGIKLILLWFATWKNGNMDYAPEWVKTNPKRFKRALAANGSDLWVLSSYCRANLEADKKAFTAFCKHLKAKDNTEHTVIGIQVENEPAIAGTDRDYCPEAQVVFDSPVPAKVMAAMKAAGKGEVYDIWQRAGGKKSGTWPEIFGWPAGEIVSAWSIATYIDSVAEAGKAVHDIPMYINSAVVGGGWRGPIPDEVSGSGQGVSKVLDIYKWVTPHVDLIATDIKMADARTFDAVCATYSRDDNPLFMPETPPTMFLFRAIADYNLIGYHRMAGLETIVADDGSVRPGAEVGVDIIRCAAAVIPLLLKYQGTGKIYAIIQEEYTAQQLLNLEGYLGRIQFGGGPSVGIGRDWRHNIARDMNWGTIVNKDRGYGLVIQANRDEFYLAGVNYRLFLTPRLSPDKPQPLAFQDNVVHGRQLRVDEGHFDQNGKFVVDRRRNGDNVSGGLWVEADIGVLRVITCD